MVRCVAVAAAAAVAVGLAARIASGAPSPACGVAVGEAVVLRSSDFDPQVLVWDSHERAIEYAGGNVRSASELITHTVLSEPGTRAIVVACLPASAKPKYTTDILDTIGIKITTGPHRGHYGWVSSDDVRGSHTAATSP